MKEICPITLEQVNEKGVQVNALLSFLSVILFFLTSHKWIILVLSIDFFIRGFLNPSYSLFSAISKKFLRIINIKPLMVDAGPKIFAAKIGFVFCLLIATSYGFNFPKISMAAGILFSICVALEAIFRFCIACKIYPLICNIKLTNS